MRAQERDDLLTLGPVARLLGLSQEAVRRLAGNGTLPALRTTNGIRLFWRSDVERVAAERARRREKRAER